MPQTQSQQLALWTVVLSSRYTHETPALTSAPAPSVQTRAGVSLVLQQN